MQRLPIWSCHWGGIPGAAPAGETPDGRAAAGYIAGVPGDDRGMAVDMDIPGVPGDASPTAAEEDGPVPVADDVPRVAGRDNPEFSVDDSGSGAEGDGVEALGPPLGEEDRLRRSFQAPALKNALFLRSGALSNSR